MQIYKFYHHVNVTKLYLYFCHFEGLTVLCSKFLFFIVLRCLISCGITLKQSSDMRMTLNKKAGNLVKKAQNIKKRKENAWILTKNAGIPAFSWKFSCLNLEVFIFTCIFNINRNLNFAQMSVITLLHNIHQRFK